eukprot:SAG11_NODE_2637_length_3145_cov_5.126724_1_plen_133_part_10
MEAEPEPEGVPEDSLEMLERTAAQFRSQLEAAEIAEKRGKLGDALRFYDEVVAGYEVAGVKPPSSLVAKRNACEAREAFKEAKRVRWQAEQAVVAARQELETRTEAAVRAGVGDISAPRHTVTPSLPPSLPPS